MLKHLSIENYVLIDRLEIDWDAHLNILTGETGAGKSILLGALGLLLGSKNEGLAMKDTSRNCVIEATFDIEGYGLEELFAEEDIDFESLCTIRRIITPAGKSRAFVGDMPVQLSSLRRIGSRLIDIHSQHQNLILSSEEFRTRTLDTLADNAPRLSAYRALYDELGRARSEYRRLAAEAESSRKDEEWLRYTVEELRAAHLKEGEQIETEQQLATLESADQIIQSLALLRQTLDDEQAGALLTLTQSEHELARLSDRYPAGGEMAARLRSVIEELKDISSTAAAETERIDADPEKLQKLSDRLNTIYSLEMKHKAADLSELIAKTVDYERRLAAIDNSDTELRRVREQIDSLERQTAEAADMLHEARASVTAALSESIEQTLARLGIADARFVVELERGEEFTPTGNDTIRFLFSANADLVPQPVERTASGGELSRVMLALKAMLAKRSKLPTIIFDEIDTGVSGRIADAMGDIICALSATMQVIDITHLPQVASKGSTHMVVYKSDGRTNVRRLSAKERIDEIAKMLSGSTITDAAREQACILLDNHQRLF
ncbi:MAG: DNA repair protein RecN [Alistipes sp.]|nr:DNA repair protein RecN [Alistipes sp.]